MKSWTCECGASVRGDLMRCTKCGLKLTVAREFTSPPEDKVQELVPGFTYEDFLKATNKAPGPKEESSKRQSQRASRSSRVIVRLKYIFRWRRPKG